jgi:hypothetical protein
MHTQISDLSSENLDVIKNTLSTLKTELKNASLIPLAVDLGILDHLRSILSKTSSFSKSCIVGNALNILHLIANDFKGSQAIAKDGKLLNLIVEMLRTQMDLEEICADILNLLSVVPHGV